MRLDSTSLQDSGQAARHQRSLHNRRKGMDPNGKQCFSAVATDMLDQIFKTRRCTSESLHGLGCETQALGMKLKPAGVCEEICSDQRLSQIFHPTRTPRDERQHRVAQRRLKLDQVHSQRKLLQQRSRLCCCGNPVALRRGPCTCQSRPLNK